MRNEIRHPPKRLQVRGGCLDDLVRDRVGLKRDEPVHAAQVVTVRTGPCVRFDDRDSCASCQGTASATASISACVQGFSRLSRLRTKMKRWRPDLNVIRRSMVCQAVRPDGCR